MKTKRPFSKLQPAAATAAAIACLALLPRPAEAQFTFSNLHSFCVFPNGAQPNALVQGRDGAFYGTTTGGGTNGGNGVVFKVRTNGVATVLHDFAGSQISASPDGGSPAGGLVQGTDGSFYGATEFGGALANGTVFNITTNGTLTVLHSFTYGSDGAYPDAALAQGSDGNFYGTTLDGGTNGVFAGTIFKITTNGTLTSLYSFKGGDDGKWCRAPLVQGSDGILYGTTTEGGTNGDGTVFKITTNGAFTSLHSFDGTDGHYPTAALVQGRNGDFYGASSSTIFKMTTNGSLTVLASFFYGATALVQSGDGSFYGTSPGGGDNSDGCVFNVLTNGALTILYSFTNSADGGFPSAALVQGSDGNYYGTSGSILGLGGPGTVFKMATNGTLATLYSFPGLNDGQDANALAPGRDGNFYGTTYQGGASGDGTVFKITANGAFARLYSFTNGVDGVNPGAALVQGSDGNFYGTTYQGGTNFGGTVFQITPDGSLTSLYSFTAGVDGANPQAALVLGRDGNFYGTTYFGGSNSYGTVFKITTNGTFTGLYSFTNGVDGLNPGAALAQGKDGNFYGTTYQGGAYSNGTVFQITTNGAFTSLYSFTGGVDGANPPAALVLGRDGNFYGTTYQGGTNGGLGTFFEITPGGSLTTLYSFSGSADGGNPNGLLAGTDGNFYGTASEGGTNYAGTVFEVTPAGLLTVLYSFSSGLGDGGDPTTSLVQGGDGSLYGTTSVGAAGGFGCIFRLGSGGPPSPPVIQSVTRSGEIVEFRWSATPGFMYQVQYKTNLNQSTWANFGSATNATGASQAAADSITNAHRFYRVLLLP